MDEAKNEENVKTDPLYGVTSESLAEIKSETIDQMSAFNSGEHQNRSDFSNYGSEQNWQANNQNLVHFEENDGKCFNSWDYYNYYSNYYQQFNAKSESTPNISQSTENNSKGRTIDLINKALAKQQLKSSTDVKDDDEEEGQIPASPGIFNPSVSGSPPNNSSRNSPFNTSHRSISRSHSRERSNRSNSRSRKRHISRSRSPSTSRRRRRSRSRSRSPYFGPIIKDYRRGRRGFVRYPRGFRDRGTRPYRRGHHSNINYYGVSRRHEYSGSRSRSFSPKRRHIEIERTDNSDDDKTMDSKHSETLKPSNINESEKRLTQSFLAMLEEKQNRAKMIPVVHNSDSTEADSNRRHGFVNTFNSIRQMEARKHTLSYDLEREGWQVIDDANTDSRHNQNSKSTENDYYDERRLQSENLSSVPQLLISEKSVEVESNSSVYEKNKKKKSKKQKKKKKRKASTSDSSDSDSDNENENQIEIKSKKRSKKKKKKRSKKRKRKVSSSSSSSENEEQIRKHKKKKKKKDSSSDSDSEDNAEIPVTPASTQQSLETNDLHEKSSSVTKEVVNEMVKSKDKKKSKRKSSDSDSTDSDSDVNNKKKKKKKKRKTSKKRKHRSSSSSSSDSSDSSESIDRKKKKKRKKSKKSKSKKHKKKSEKKEKSKLTDDKKRIKEEVEETEFVSVMSVGEPPLELKWPKKSIKYTLSLPPLQYSINPRVIPNPNDFRDIHQIRDISKFEDIQRNESIIDQEIPGLNSEYERFIGELNPENQSMNEETHSLESELRDRLVKQYYDRKDTHITDLMTSSERRAFEKNKKPTYHSYDGSDHKRHEDLKAAPLNAYYSPKVPKSSLIHKSNDSENIEQKSNKNDENVEQNIMGSIIEEHTAEDELTHKPESKICFSKIEDKKVMARELLDRVKRKNSDKMSKESTNKEKSENKSNKKLPQIGKLKTLSKKLLSKKSLTTTNADSTQNALVSQPMALDMNYDYNWYYNYYMNSVYGVGQYPQVNDPALASAYYAQYSMLTSYDYNQNDVNNWITQRGYSLDNSSDINQIQTDVKSTEEINEKIIKTEGLESSVELSASDLNKDDNNQTNLSSEQIGDKQSNVGHNSASNEINGQKNIEVLVSVSHSDIPFDESNETKDEPKSSTFNENNGAPNDIESIDNNSCESPPPPPPPPRPVMTSLTSTEPITLLNGQILPAGTKQVVVHPYQTGEPYKFTAEWFTDSFNSQNSKTNSS